MKKKLVVLVITYLPWDINTNVGNTLNNILNNDDYEIHNIFIKDSSPSYGLISSNFHISEKQLLFSIFSRKAVGKKYKRKENIEKNTFYELRRNDFVYLVQDLIGIFGCWKSIELHKYIDDVKPDVIFSPLGRYPLINIINSYIKIKYDIPLISYIWDDHYSMKKFSLNPIFWIKLLIERVYIKKTISTANEIFVISNKMKSEYDILFGIKSHVIYKSYDFCKKPNYIQINNKSILITYMGNMGSGRWKEILNFARVINVLNRSSNSLKFILNIYTFTILSKNIVMKLTDCYGVYVYPPVEYNEIQNTLKSSDILLYVDPLNIKDSLFYRLSFSTKLVDYFYAGRCILAIGKSSAGIEYLRHHNAAIILNNSKEYSKMLNNLLVNRKIIEEYSNNSWDCGSVNHQASVLKKEIKSIFLGVVK